MQVYFSSKNFNPSGEFESLYKSFVSTLTVKVKEYEGSLPLLIFLIERNTKNNRYTGKITLSLGPITLFKIANGSSDQGVLQKIFDKLFEELEMHRYDLQSLGNKKRRYIGGESYEMSYL